MSFRKYLSFSKPSLKWNWNLTMHSMNSAWVDNHIHIYTYWQVFLEFWLKNIFNIWYSKQYKSFELFLYWTMDSYIQHLGILDIFCKSLTLRKLQVHQNWLMCLKINVQSWQLQSSEHKCFCKLNELLFLSRCLSPQLKLQFHLFSSFSFRWITNSVFFSEK